MGLFRLLPAPLRQKLILNGIIQVIKQGQAQHLGRQLKVYLLSKKEDDLSDEAVLMLLGEVAEGLEHVAQELRT